MDKGIVQETARFTEALGYDEEPMGIFYTDEEPAEGFSPDPMPDGLPTRAREQAGDIDWGSVFGNFSCVIGHIWRARKKKTAAYFDAERFGCPGGAFYLGYLGPQTDTIVYYVSTGVPGQMPGELYFPAPEDCRTFFEYIAPRPAPARFCVVKPLSLFGPEEEPELVAFFCRPETLCGLHQLVTFVTGDLQGVMSPMGAGCSNLITWPLHYLIEGSNKAVLGGWDPSARKYFKTDELSLTMPWDMFTGMLSKWEKSFLTTKTWQGVMKKVGLSKKRWGEE